MGGGGGSVFICSILEEMMSKTKPHYLPSGKLHKGETHKVGTVLMTGAKHTPASKPLTHTPPPKKK